MSHVEDAAIAVHIVGASDVLIAVYRCFFADLVDGAVERNLFGVKGIAERTALEGQISAATGLGEVVQCIDVPGAQYQRVSVETLSRIVSKLHPDLPLISSKRDLHILRYDLDAIRVIVSQLWVPLCLVQLIDASIVDDSSVDLQVSAIKSVILDLLVLPLEM